MLGVQCSCTGFCVVIILNEISACIAYKSVAQPVLLIEVWLIKDMYCCFGEITFSCKFFVCLSCISFGQYFQINIFKSGGFGKKCKRDLDHIGGFLQKRAVLKIRNKATSRNISATTNKQKALWEKNWGVFIFN